MKWDVEGKKHFQSGVDHVALFVALDKDQTAEAGRSHMVMPYATTVTNIGQGANGFKLVSEQYNKGVAWNGITAINENPSGGETTTLYADNIAYLNMQSAEKYGFSIEAYDYPDEWEACDGTLMLGALRVGQQKRKKFALAYRTWYGSDTQALGDDEALHFVWGCSAAVSPRNHQTVNESPEAATMSWECTANTVSWTTDNSFDGNGEQTTIPVVEYKCAHMSVKKSDCAGTNKRNKSLSDAYAYIERTVFGNPSVDANDGLMMTPEGIWLTLNFYDGTTTDNRNETLTVS